MVLTVAGGPLRAGAHCRANRQAHDLVQSGPTAIDASLVFPAGAADAGVTGRALTWRLIGAAAPGDVTDR